MNKHKDKILEWIEFFSLLFVRKGKFSDVSGTCLYCMYVSGSPTGIRKKKEKKAIEDNKRSGDCDACILRFSHVNSCITSVYHICCLVSQLMFINKSYFREISVE